MATYQVILRPSAEEDIAEGMAWYAQRAPGLDDEFFEAVSSTMDRLSTSPKMYSEVRGEVRRAVLTRFPYLLFFIVEGSVVTVLACIHERRDPTEWPAE